MHIFEHVSYSKHYAEELLGNSSSLLIDVGGS